VLGVSIKARISSEQARNWERGYRCTTCEVRTRTFQNRSGHHGRGRQDRAEVPGDLGLYLREEGMPWVENKTSFWPVLPEDPLQKLFRGEELKNNIIRKNSWSGKKGSGIERTEKFFEKGRRG